MDDASDSHGGSRDGGAPRRSAVDRLVIAAFLLAMAVPLVATVAGLDREGLAEENREAAPFPTLTFNRASIAAWPDAFTHYFADHFAFRSSLVRWQAQFRVRVLGASPSPDVIVGRHGWLFYATDGAVEDYTAASPLSVTELDVWRTTLQHTQDWLARRGIAYLFVVAPDKHVVYPEFMPDDIQRVGAASRLDQLLADLREKSTVHVLDLRPALMAAKASDRLYHRTDTHWNDRGALVAYQQILAALDLPGGIRPAARTAFDATPVETPGMDLARMLGLRSVMTEEDLTLVPRAPRVARVVEPGGAVTTSSSLMVARVVTEGPVELPRAVVFRDSFGSALIPFLSEHFSRALYLWQNDVDPEVIAAEHPQVVIQEWVGRHLHTVTPYDAIGARDGGAAPKPGRR